MQRNERISLFFITIFQVLQFSSFQAFQLVKFSSLQVFNFSTFSKFFKFCKFSSSSIVSSFASVQVFKAFQVFKFSSVTSLQTSEIFNNEARNLVANDIFDNRFDLLLLPNRFDCEEVSRINNQDIVEELPTTPELDECPICLGTSEVDSKLPCQHLFCKSCIQRWANQSLECPLCRRSFSLEDITDL